MNRLEHTLDLGSAALFPLAREAILTWKLQESPRDSRGCCEARECRIRDCGGSQIIPSRRSRSVG